MTNEELVEGLGVMLRSEEDEDAKSVLRESINRLREQDGEWIEEGLANLFYAYEDAKKALASVLAAYDELAFGLSPQEK